MNVSSTLLTAIMISLPFVSCAGYSESQRKAEANKIIVKLDDFKNRTNRLPESLSEIGIVEDETGPIAPQPINGTHELRSFGLLPHSAKIACRSRRSCKVSVFTGAYYG